MAKSRGEKDYEKLLMKKNAFNDLENPRGILCDRFKSGSVRLDQILGGGYVRPGVIEIYGAEASGKTTLSLHALKEIQQKNPDNIVFFIDMEHTFGKDYAQRIGLNLKSAFPINPKTGQMDFDKRIPDGQFLFSQPDSGEEALSLVIALLKKGIVQGGVIDSVTSLVPKAELEGEITDSHYALLARMMSKALRIITPLIKRGDATVIFTNQTRTNIGQMYGDKENPTGGSALKFYSRQRIKTRKVRVFEKDNEPVGIQSNVKIIKNKVGSAYKQSIITICSSGIEVDEELFDIAMDYNIIQKAGSWFELGKKKFQGRDSAMEYFSENKKLKDKVLDYVYKKFGGGSNSKSLQK